jgi:membrane associated rhomboid family serine protease
MTISVGGHLGGLAAGVAMMWFLLQNRRSTAYSLGSAAAVAALSIAVAYWRVRGYM